MDENSGLSPQRRGFSSGCRAPQEDKERSSAKEAGKDKDNGGEWMRGIDGKTRSQKMAIILFYFFWENDSPIMINVFFFL